MKETRFGGVTSLGLGGLFVSDEVLYMKVEPVLVEGEGECGRPGPEHNAVIITGHPSGYVSCFEDDDRVLWLELRSE